MTLPSLIIGLLISTLYGALLHLIRGGGPGRLLLYLFLAWLGFWGGHFWGEAQGWTFLSLGPLRLGAATLGAVSLLTIAFLLSFADDPAEA